LKDLYILETSYFKANKIDENWQKMGAKTFVSEA